MATGKDFFEQINVIFITCPWNCVLKPTPAPVLVTCLDSGSLKSSHFRHAALCVLLTGHFSPSLELLIGSSLCLSPLKNPVVADVGVGGAVPWADWPKECKLPGRAINWDGREGVGENHTQLGKVFNSYVSEYPNSNPNGNPPFWGIHTAPGKQLMSSLPVSFLSRALRDSTVPFHKICRW